MDRISVIIPVYNVEAYLPQCLDSVLSQDHRDLEVILIDDGSTDASGAICDGYAARDSRVRVIHQKNGGAAAAKNAGLRIATGTYLSFVDSDDYLEPNVYGYMLGVLKEHGADAAQFSFREVYRSRREDQILCRGREILDHKSYLLRFPKDWTCALLWNKLYKRALFDGVFFEEGHRIDDEYFTYQGFLGKGILVRDEKIIYNYRKRASGAMGNPKAALQRLMDCLDCTVKRRENVLAHHPDLKKAFDENYLDTLWYLSENYGNTLESLLELKLGLKTYFRQKGHSLPPRYLWGRLWKLYRTPADKLLRKCQEARETVSTEDYFP